MRKGLELLEAGSRQGREWPKERGVISPFPWCRCNTWLSRCATPASESSFQFFSTWPRTWHRVRYGRCSVCSSFRVETRLDDLCRESVSACQILFANDLPCDCLSSRIRKHSSNVVETESSKRWNVHIHCFCNKMRSEKSQWEKLEYLNVNF